MRFYVVFFPLKTFFWPNLMSWEGSFSIKNGLMPCISLQCSQWTSKVQISDILQVSLFKLLSKTVWESHLFLPQVTIVIIDPTCFSWVKGCVVKHFITYYITYIKTVLYCKPQDNVLKSILLRYLWLNQVEIFWVCQVL